MVILPAAPCSHSSPSQRFIFQWLAKIIIVHKREVEEFSDSAKVEQHITDLKNPDKDVLKTAFSQGSCLYIAIGAGAPSKISKEEMYDRDVQRKRVMANIMTDCVQWGAMAPQAYVCPRPCIESADTPWLSNHRKHNCDYSRKYIYLYWDLSINNWTLLIFVAAGICDVTLLGTTGPDINATYSALTGTIAGGGYYRHCKGQVEENIKQVYNWALLHNIACPWMLILLCYM